MKNAILATILSSTLLSFADSKFEQDRAAILAMAGHFEITFAFEETIPLVEGYKLQKPYNEDARELVKVVSDTGTEITLQHILVMEDMDGPRIIKHWGQIWKYEDPLVLDYEGNMTWLPRTLSEEEVKGTWTQFVTQVDDSPRYKAAGTWEHSGNYSAWTSLPSTRPLPRREYTKRSDYDLLKVVNKHVITPEGWVHMQDNRKFVRRNGLNKSLCLERGTNTYFRMTDLDDIEKEDFAVAEKYWQETGHFWADVRSAWDTIIASSTGPVAYESRILAPKDEKVVVSKEEAELEKATKTAGEEETEKPKEKKLLLMARMWGLAETFTTDPSAASPLIIDKVLKQHLR
ncbi:MAG: DUF6607 family protein [Verrucomicrobiota bacterium]